MSATTARSQSTALTNTDTVKAAADPRYEFGGQEAGSRDVRLSVESYIPFERLHSWQRAARHELRERLRSLVAETGEILHASYAGYKPHNMDIENLLLYNIEGGGCFLPSVQHGIRFELASGAETSLKGRYPCAYRYRLIPADSELAFDAVVAALTARAAARGLVTSPSQDQNAVARTEGWIALPTSPLAGLWA